MYPKGSRRPALGPTSTRCYVFLSLTSLPVRFSPSSTMKPFFRLERRNVLSNREQLHEKVILAVTFLACLAFFVKIVFL